MKSTRRLLGLATIAIGMLCAVAASPAAADPEHEFITEQTHTAIDGVPLEATQFATVVGSVSCSSETHQGTSGSTTFTTLTLSPTFHGCKLGGSEATVTMNECDFQFHSAGKVVTSTAPRTVDDVGTFSIECPTGKKIEIHSSLCTITILPQSRAESIRFTNENSTQGSTRSFKADFDVAELEYVLHGFCSIAVKTEVQHDGTLNGELTISGKNTVGEHAGIWVDSPSGSSEYDLKSEKSATLTGSAPEEGQFVMSVGSVLCEEVAYHGSSSTTMTSVSFTPTYTGCEFVQGISSFKVVVTGGCKFAFLPGSKKTTNGEPHEIHYEASLSWTCQIEIHDESIGAECTITIPAQNNRRNVTIKNEGAGATRRLIFDLDVYGVTYITHGSSCNTNTKTEDQHDGEFLGDVTVSGQDNEGKHVGIWAE